MEVTHEAPVPAPASFDRFMEEVERIAPDGVVWHRFATELAHADVAVIGDTSVFLLNWIESFAPGNGSAVLRAVGDWADANDMTGLLVCERDRALWFRDVGRWKRTGRIFNDAAEMQRKPVPGKESP